MNNNLTPIAETGNESELMREILQLKADIAEFEGSLFRDSLLEPLTVEPSLAESTFSGRLDDSVETLNLVDIPNPPITYFDKIEDSRDFRIDYPLHLPTTSRD